MHCTAATNSLTYFSRQHSALFCCCIQISAATDHYTLNFLLLNSVDYYFRILLLFSTLVVMFKKFLSLMILLQAVVLICYRLLLTLLLLNISFSVSTLYTYIY